MEMGNGRGNALREGDQAMQNMPAFVICNIFHISCSGSLVYIFQPQITQPFFSSVVDILLALNVGFGNVKWFLLTINNWRTKAV